MVFICHKWGVLAVDWKALYDKIATFVTEHILWVSLAAALLVVIIVVVAVILVSRKKKRKNLRPSLLQADGIQVESGNAVSFEKEIENQPDFRLDFSQADGINQEDAIKREETDNQSDKKQALSEHSEREAVELGEESEKQPVPLLTEPEESPVDPYRRDVQYVGDMLNQKDYMAAGSRILEMLFTVEYELNEDKRKKLTELLMKIQGR